MAPAAKPLEVEAKLRVRDVAALRRRLREAGVRLGRAVRQEDAFLQHPARDLAAGDEALRLRRTAGSWELTYKGPRQATGTKTRREETWRLRQDPWPMLEALGFTAGPRVRKSRRTARLGRVTVAWDEVDGLGTFLELEVMATASGAAGARKAIDQAVRKLGLVDEPRLREAYVELLHAAVKRA